MPMSEDVCECRASVTDNPAAQIGLMHLRSQKISFTNTLRPVTQFDSSYFEFRVTNCATWHCCFRLALLFYLICVEKPIYPEIRSVCCFP